MEKKIDIEKSKIAELKHLEKLELLQKSKETVGKQLSIDIDKGNLHEIDEIKELINRKFEDPEEKFQLFYKGIQNVLVKFLPRGRHFYHERRIIHDEKLIFLNRGKARQLNGRRGSDSRMTYNEDLNEMVSLVTDWVVNSLDPVDLYQQLYDLNEKYGYGHQFYDETSKSFENAMNKIKG